MEKRLIVAVLVLFGLMPAVAFADSFRPHVLVRNEAGTYVPFDFTEEILAQAPLCIRHENYWCVKTPPNWDGKVGSDARGHAIFADPAMGARAFAVLMRTYRFKYERETAKEIISRYAPATDCVGSIGIPPDCPHGLNPVNEYALEIAKAVGKSADEKLDLFADDGRIDLRVAIPLFQAFARFELTAKYQVSEELIRQGIAKAGIKLLE